jgi:serine/threonine protein kinase
MVEVVGVGTYGCVTKPSLKCSDSETKYDYDNKVSKLMIDEDAIEEKKEMENISTIPNIDKYILKLPILCKPMINDEYNTILTKCGKENWRIKKTIKANKQFSDLSILLLDDGGVSLKDVQDKLFKNFNMHETQCFLTSILNLIEGVDFFVHNNIIHHDIKLDNIVYNVSNGKIKFIDFGIMTTRDKFIHESTQSENSLASQSWFYFPKEFSCLNQDVFKQLTKCEKYKKQKGFTYSKFITKAASSFDSYCLTFALTNFFKHFQHLKYCKHVPSSFWDTSIVLMKQYFDPDIYKRNIDLTYLHKEYQSILEQHNLYSKEKSKSSLSTLRIAKSLSIQRHIEKSNSLPKPVLIQTEKNNKKRCPNGTRRNKNGDCVANNDAKPKAKIVIHETKPPAKIVIHETKPQAKIVIQDDKQTETKKKRCPNGTRRNKNGECVAYK